MMSDWKNKLYFGDNLQILKDNIADESVDLIYLDPPFNSKATYNVLYKAQDGSQSTSQITAFDDTWHWGEEAAISYHEIVTGGPPEVADLLQALKSFLGMNDMMAYLTMMTIRLIQLRRVLKPSGSIYLHCDPTASHYLKLLMDAVFGKKHFRNEIVWGYRTGGVSKKYFAKKHDIILFYSKGNVWKFYPLKYKSWQKKRYAYNEKYKEYFDEEEQRWFHLAFCRDVWDDIDALGTDKKERLGYPTQKPEALLQRIIQASSNKGDIVLDPFCGCGTAIAVAEATDRKWIGIDVAYMAITLIKRRLSKSFGRELSPFAVEGIPRTLQDARALAESGPEGRYQFQWWAIDQVDAHAINDRRKGADRGVDGTIFFFDDNSGIAKKILLQVKSGHVNRGVIAVLRGDMEAQKATLGVLISLEPPTRPMITEALSAGFYTPPAFPNRNVQKIQILTTKELFEGKGIDYYKLDSATFRDARSKPGKKDTIQEKPRLRNDIP